MLFVAGLIAVALLVFGAIVVAITFLTFIVGAALLIGAAVVLAVVGGVIGYALFQNVWGAIIGAALAIVCGIVAIGLESNRSEGQRPGKSPFRPTPDEPVIDRLDELSRSTDRRLREEQERFEARKLLAIKLGSAGPLKPTSEVPKNGLLPGWVRKMLG